MDGWAYRLKPEKAELNLNPSYAAGIRKHFEDAAIQWHRHANHALSSQVCCVNFLAPLAHEPDLLSRVVAQALKIAPPAMLPVCGDRFVDFEWTGKEDYLSEWPKDGRATRGANATSADAVVRFDTGSTVCTALIEWKYTECYGAPLADKNIPGHGNDKRRARYADKLLDPDGPIRADLGLTIDDFFWEPFYQLVRQQMLAHRMEGACEDGAERVLVLHLSPRGNSDLHRVTSPALRKFGDDAFTVFSKLLVRPDRFHACNIESAFLPVIDSVGRDSPSADWAQYLRERYQFLSEAA
ncbi:hypothetical protein LG047_11895 [Methylocystis sp. WRRC1]|uniref:PGN_0703 family putative restriction endonuclease n=1 Tax=Methylocystis sp. WRRC1 TaxID=1732014 RepID=UPI001D150589|nr:hypothetical protein [Methylocystis sp. WRRC1]MCC3246027.1 hypothetical protein [Methylocystis sp. WRRC1]